MGSSALDVAYICRISWKLTLWDLKRLSNERRREQGWMNHKHERPSKWKMGEGPSTKRFMGDGYRSRWRTRWKGVSICFLWRLAGYWQSRINGEGAQMPHYCGLRNEWTMTGGSSECGQVFHKVREELRKWNNLFRKNTEFNIFWQQNISSWCFTLI